MSFCKKTFLILFFLSNFLFSACKESSSSSNGSTIGDTDPTSGSNTASAILYLELYIKPESSADESYSLYDGCYINASATAPQDTTCNINIPELTMHYSDISFKIGTNSSTSCELVMFRPYYYLRSTNANYVPQAGDPGTDVDCTTITNANRCYGGAGPAIVPSFGTNTAVYFLPKSTLFERYNMLSPNLRRADTPDDSFSTNVDVANNLPAASRGAAYVGNGVQYNGGNAYADYYVACLDEWATSKFSITLTLGDDDTEDTPSSLDQFYDWGF